MKARYFLYASAVAVACAHPSPPPDGRAEIDASRRALQTVTNFSMTSTSTTDIGTFRTSIEVDCTHHYYHESYVVDLTPKGIEGNSRELQGRARAHRETEELYVDGHPYTRHSGTWENPPPGTGDANAAFELIPNNSLAERADCESIHAEANLLTVPYKQMAKATAIAFLGARTLDGVACSDFQVKYEDLVWGDRMTSPNGKDSSYSERETVKRPEETTVCIGTVDKRVYRSIQTSSGLSEIPVTRTFSYGKVTMLPDPTKAN